MAENKKNRRLLQKLTHKYRLIVYNDNTFEEVWYLRLSRLNLIAILGLSFFAFIALLIVIIAFTPVRELIPGYPSGEMRRDMIINNIKIDSLEHNMSIKEQYYYNLHAILNDEEPMDIIEKEDTTIRYSDIEFKKSVYDSMLRQQIEKEEQFNLILSEESNSPIDFSRTHFFVPLKGIVTNTFNIDKNHFGIDIVSSPNKVVSAVLPGTVTLANWTLETGYVIQIQHDNNIISVYKHNSVLLKKAGNYVKAGEAIAIVGNSGELTTGPHLHFELWHNGKPLNPEDYILF